MMHARCPEEPDAWDYYTVTVEPPEAEFITVERIRAVLRCFCGAILYQEDLTRELAAALCCRVTTEGLHRTTRTTVTAEP